MQSVNFQKYILNFYCGSKQRSATLYIKLIIVYFGNLQDFEVIKMVKLNNLKYQKKKDKKIWKTFDTIYQNYISMQYNIKCLKTKADNYLGLRFRVLLSIPDHSQQLHSNSANCVFS